MPRYVCKLWMHVVHQHYREYHRFLLTWLLPFNSLLQYLFHSFFHSPCHSSLHSIFHFPLHSLPHYFFFSFRFFLGSPNTVPSLMALSTNFRAKPLLAAAALSAARNLVTTEEAVLGTFFCFFFVIFFCF